MTEQSDGVTDARIPALKSYRGYSWKFLREPCGGRNGSESMSPDHKWGSLRCAWVAGDRARTCGRVATCGACDRAVNGLVPARRQRHEALHAFWGVSEQAWNEEENFVNPLNLWYSGSTKKRYYCIILKVSLQRCRVGEKHLNTKGTLPRDVDLCGRGQSGLNVPPRMPANYPGKRRRLFMFRGRQKLSMFWNVQKNNLTVKRRRYRFFESWVDILHIHKFTLLMYNT